MKSIQQIIPITLLFIAMGCGGRTSPPNEKKYFNEQDDQLRTNSPGSITEASNEEMTDSTSVYLEQGNAFAMNPMGSSAAGLSSDSTRKLIKTADLKFRVKSAIQATYEIEDITRKFKGFVTQTHLESRVDGTTIIPMSPDSSVETVYYTVTNTMTIRVPQAKLDSTLRAFTPLVDYLDHRNIDVQDVYLEMLRNKLTQQRITNYQNRVKGKVDSKGKNLDEINNTEEAILMRQEQADNAKIETLSMLDKIEYSTITLFIYQRQAVKREMVFNSKNIEAYEPGFGYQLKQSLGNGWHAVKSLILFFIQFWPLFLIVLIAFIVIKMVKRK